VAVWEAVADRESFLVVYPDGSSFPQRWNIEVVLYWIEGQGHAWPGGPALPLLGEAVSDLNASEVLWAFFREHPMVQAP
jgi:poly(3-hydroxybutyrate) depolymerase